MLIDIKEEKGLTVDEDLIFCYDKQIKKIKLSLESQVELKPQNCAKITRG